MQKTENVNHVSIDNAVAKVYQTNDYSKFEKLQGNRPVNENHLRRLKVSFELKQLFSPIIVNEKYQIIDGQHRFTVCEQLGLPIHYIITKNYGLREVKILNQNTSNWTKSAFLESYCELGYENYLKFRNFKRRFPKFNFTICEVLLTQRTGSKNEHENGKNVSSKYFEEGKLTIPNIDISIEQANRIYQIGNYYSGFNRTNFVKAMVKMFKNENFDFQWFLKNLKKLQTRIYDAPSITDYIVIIEDIYNHGRKNKVNLRF